VTILLSDRVQGLQPSATLAISARANELRNAGKDIISLSVGEPDFPTPAHVISAAEQAMREGFTRYTAVDGIAPLKQAIIEKLATENQLNYQPTEIIVSSGCKQSIYNLLQATLNPLDEAIIPAPYWVSYPEMVRLTGAKPIIIPTTIDSQYKITPSQLARAITPKTRLLLLNSPSNPTGICYTHAELRELGNVLLDHPNVIIASDDIYEYFQWNGEHFANIATLLPQLASRTVVLNGVSKAYAMTGWRIGYAAGPEAIIKGMKKIQSQSTSNPCSISQKAALAAITGPRECVQEMCAAFQTRHQYVYERLSAIEGINTIPANGTFYIFPDIQAIIDRLPKINNDVEFAEHMLNNAGVAMVPGTAFGAPGCIRISFATSQTLLEKALDRFEAAIKS
jgi:aspartate aminotransferase